MPSFLRRLLAAAPVLPAAEEERRAGPEQGAFTLVELLAVVAAVGLLAALLLPAARSALTHTRMAESASNLRQIGIAFHEYAADHDGLLCPYIPYSYVYTIANLGLKLTPIYYPPIYGNRTNPRPWIWLMNSRYCPANQNGVVIRLLSPRVQYDNGWGLIPMTSFPPSAESASVYLLKDSYMNYNISYPATPITPWPGNIAHFLFVDGHVAGHDDNDASWWGVPSR